MEPRSQAGVVATVLVAARPWAAQTRHTQPSKALSLPSSFVSFLPCREGFPSCSLRSLLIHSLLYFKIRCTGHEFRSPHLAPAKLKGGAPQSQRTLPFPHENGLISSQILSPPACGSNTSWEPDEITASTPTAR